MRWYAAGALAGLICVGCDDSPTTPTAPLSSIRIVPDVPLLVSGARQAFQAIGTRGSGTEAPLAAAWITDDPNVLLVDGAGNVTGRAPGTATLFASAEGKIGSRAIRVIGDASGTFEGSWTLTGCDANDFRTCSRCCSLGTVGRMTVAGRQDGDRVHADMSWTWMTPGTIGTPAEATAQIVDAAGAFTTSGFLSLAGPQDPRAQLFVWEGRFSSDGQSLTGRFTYASAPPDRFSTLELSGTFALARVSR